MPARVLEVTVFTAVTLIVVMALFSSGLMSVPVVKESVRQNEMEAKQLYLSLDTLPAKNASLPPGNTVIDILRHYYTTGEPRYIDLAESNIRYNADRLVSYNDTVWRAYTSDGKLNVRSSFYSEARVKGSASVSLLNETKLVVVVGSL